MNVCPRCSELHPDDVGICPKDGTRLSPVRDPLIGRTVGGRFRLIQRLGTGGMSSVYLARHVLIDRLMAIKTLRRDLARDPIQRDRFLREARAVNRINHENIVEISDFGETEDGLVYLVMEYVPGEPLLMAMGGVPMPALRALHIAEQCAQALGRAHQMGVIHRDLKPENILLVQRRDHPDFVKLLDFGIAKILDAPSLTGSQQIFGTPGYIAPEYIQSTDIDGRADLYSLGCILYELVTGALPFDYQYPGDLLVKHVTEAPVPPSTRLPRVEPVVEAFILRALAKDPSERFRDAFHFNAELRAVRERLGPDDRWGGLNEERAGDEADPGRPSGWVPRPAPATTPDGISVPSAADTLIDNVSTLGPRSLPPPDGIPAEELELPEVLIEVDVEDAERRTLVGRAFRPAPGEAPAIPEPPPVDQVQHASRPDELRGAVETPTPVKVHRQGMLGARRWRERFDAIRACLDEVEARRPAPAAVAAAMALASRTLDDLEAGIAAAGQHQVSAERLTARARELRATLGRAIDQVAGRLSEERGRFEALVTRRNSLRTRQEGARVGVRQGSTPEGDLDALLWELAVVEEELRTRGNRCDDLEGQLADLTAELDGHNEEIEAEQERLVRILDQEMVRLEEMASRLRRPLDLVEQHVRQAWPATPDEGQPPL
ncbi:MAG: protein kinase [Sandaracinaceae bacterium]